MKESVLACCGTISARVSKPGRRDHRLPGAEKEQIARIAGLLLERLAGAEEIDRFKLEWISAAAYLAEKASTSSGAPLKRCIQNLVETRSPT